MLIIHIFLENTPKNIPQICVFIEKLMLAKVLF